MDREGAEEVLGEGKFLRLLRRQGWEFVTRARPVRGAFIAAVTDSGCLILTEEYRIPLGQAVVGCPAGLVGDADGQESEELAEAVRRELREEAGFEARSVTLLSAGPTSPGVTDEVIAIVLAQGLRKVGPGGGVEGEKIVVHEVPLTEVDAWLAARVRQGHLVDPKVYTCLYFLGRGPAASRSASV